MADLGSDSDDEDFEANSAADEMSEDVDYRGNENASESSDTDDILNGFDSESDGKMEIEHDDDHMNPPVCFYAIYCNMQKRQKMKQKLFIYSLFVYNNSFSIRIMFEIQGLSEGKGVYADKERFK